MALSSRWFDLPHVAGSRMGAVLLVLGFRRCAARSMLEAEFRRYYLLSRDRPGDHDGNARRLHWMTERLDALRRLESGASVDVHRDPRCHFAYEIRVGMAGNGSMSAKPSAVSGARREIPHGA